MCCWASGFEGYYCLTLEMQTRRCVATSGATRPATQPYIPEDLKLPSRRSAFRNVSCTQSSVFAHARVHRGVFSERLHRIATSSSVATLVCGLPVAFRQGQLGRLQAKELTGNGELKEMNSDVLLVRRAGKWTRIRLKSQMNLNYSGKLTSYPAVNTPSRL